MTVLLWFILIVAFGAIVFGMTCISVVFEKAEKPWWGCVIPIYGIMLLCDIAGKPRRWAFLCLIPFVNIAANIVLSYGVARHFERDSRFGLGLVLLPVIFYGILAFGDSDYTPFEFQPEEAKPARRPSSASMTRPLQKAAPSVSPMTRLEPQTNSASDSARQRPRLARCPFCRSTTFHLVEEAGSRRCSNCHSVLPSYARGNE